MSVNIVHPDYSTECNLDCHSHRYRWQYYKQINDTPFAEWKVEEEFFFYRMHNDHIQSYDGRSIGWVDVKLSKSTLNSLLLISREECLLHLIYEKPHDPIL